MEIIIMSLAALIASLLTFFSDFGLGTILTPVLVIFFPVEVAIALTGIVHLLNNFFKICLVGSKINWEIGIKFGGTAIIGVFTGAKILTFFSNCSPLYIYSINYKVF